MGIFGKEQDGYGMESSFTTFTTSRYSSPDKPRNDLIRMRGKRFVTASETDDPHVKMDTALLKRISGNDDMAVRANFKQEIEYTPQAKVFLRMNNEPRILDDTDATWERVKKIIFRRRFTEDEKDQQLTEKLLAMLFRAPAAKAQIGMVVNVQPAANLLGRDVTGISVTGETHNARTQNRIVAFRAIAVPKSTPTQRNTEAT
jgi:hypothetical protein